MNKKVAVVGAGVIGISVGEALARKGVEVTVLDRGAIGSGTSATSYAWINSNNKHPDSYYELNLAGLRAHRRLAPDGADWVSWNGHVEMAADDAHCAELGKRVARLQELGYPVRELDVAGAREELGDVRVPAGVKLAVKFLDEGHCYPALYIAEMLARGRQAGMTVREGQEVVGFSEIGPSVRLELAGGSELVVDEVVLAAGRWTGELSKTAGVDVPMANYQHPGDVTVGYLATTEPLPARVPSLMTTPRLNVRPAGGGRLLLQALDLDLTADPGRNPRAVDGLADQFLARLSEVVENTAGAQLAKIEVGQRVMPADGLTVAGPSTKPWLYAVATHSGVTLAPFLGEAVSEELLGREQSLLNSFRPDRFAGDGAIAPPVAPRRPGEQ